MSDTPRIVLVGCSFAGLEFVYRYVRARRRLLTGELTIVEPRHYHPYIPLAHEAASGASSPESLRFDVEAFCASVGITFVSDRALGLDTHARQLHLESGRALAYDRLIVAVGSEPAIPRALAASSLVPAKWLSPALDAHERIRAIHSASHTPARITIVGTGITGVEWAAELAGSVIAGIRPAVTLIGQDRRLLPAFAPGIANHAARVLTRLGVRCMLERTVADVGPRAVVLDDGERIDADVSVWAGGVRPNEAVPRLGLPLTSGGHIGVTPRLAVPNVQGVYAIGDAARVVEGGASWPTMERAIEAIWQGALLGRRLAARLADDNGPTHRLRRDFFYGLSLGPSHSVVLYGRWWADSRVFVYFRRWLKWAYYKRFTLLARVLSRGRSKTAAVTALR